MSYDEVERGLPPVEDVTRGTWRSPRRHLPVSIIHPTWALITPGTDSSSASPSTPRVKHDDDQGRDRHLGNDDGGFVKTTKRPAPPPPTQRYLIQDGGDNDMKVIKLDPFASIPGTLDRPSSPPRKPRVPRPKLTRQKKSLSFPLPPTVRVTATSPSVQSSSTTVIARRAKHFVILLLTLLPPLFFTVAVYYLKFSMADFGVAVLGLCVFQPIAWPSLIFSIFNKIWLKLNVGAAIRRGWLELLLLGILSPGAVILQLMSLMNLDVTVSLALNFAPLVIVALIRNISEEGSFSVELCLTSVMVYLGLTLIGLSTFYFEVQQDQNQFLLGFGASVGSMMLTIPSCFLLTRLRGANVDDSITASAVAIGGTIISGIIGVITGFNQRESEIDPGILSFVITFIFFGTIFQFIESKLNRKSEGDKGRGREIWDSQSRPLGLLRLSRTRLGIFCLSSFVELIKLGLNSKVVYFSTPFNILGVVLVLAGYMMTVGYESWWTHIKFSTSKMEIRRNRFLFLPWLFSNKS